MNTWKLLKAEAPTKAPLMTPDLVKLTFETCDGRAREFLWGRIAGPLRGPPEDPALYAGTVYSQSGNKALPPIGTVVEFSREHVVDLEVVLRIRRHLEVLGRPSE